MEMSCIWANGNAPYSVNIRSWWKKPRHPLSTNASGKKWQQQQSPWQNRQAIKVWEQWNSCSTIRSISISWRWTPVFRWNTRLQKKSPESIWWNYNSISLRAGNYRCVNLRFTSTAGLSNAGSTQRTYKPDFLPVSVLSVNFVYHKAITSALKPVLPPVQKLPLFSILW